jgi:glycosyltransferase involved in cell wall biosynthesis
VTNFKIIINCGPCEDFIGACLGSVKDQTWADWQAFVTIDACGDDSYRRAVGAAGGDPRIHIQKNETRRYSMYNLIHAIQRSNAEPEDVIANLDGDDWFSDDDALRKIAAVYDRQDCWMTYGSWLSNVERSGGGRDGRWPAYPDGDIDFRRHRFLGTAPRTWKKWLWDYLEDADLRSDSGDYVRVSEDQMVMIPLLEMCGQERAGHIADPIMTYNKLIKYPNDESLNAEGLRNGARIDQRARYPRLERKIYRGSLQACSNSL